MRTSLAFAALALVACAHPGAPSAPRWTDADILAFVPADSPYVIGTASGQQANQATTRISKRYFERAVHRARENPDRPESHIIAAFLDATGGGSASLSATARIENAGIAHQAGFAMYGDPVYPIFRIEVANPVALRGVLRKMLAAAGPEAATKIVEQQSAGVPYWTFTGDKVGVIAVVHDRDLTVALLPSDQLAAHAPRLVADPRPLHSLRDTIDVRALESKHHLLDAMFVIADTGRAFEQLTKVEKLGLGSPECHADLARIAALAPRLVGGYSERDEQHYAIKLAVDLEPGLAHALEGLRAPTPALSKDPVASLQLGVDLDRALAFLQDAAAGLAARPLTCAPLGELNAAIAKAASDLPANLPPQVHGLRGLSIAVDDLALDPPSGRGELVVLGGQIGAVVPELLGKNPLTSMLHLAVGGPPIELPTAMFKLPAAHAALAQDRIAVAVGGDSAASAVTALKTPVDPNAPLAQVYWNIRWFATHLEQIGLKNMEEYEDMTMRLDVRDGALELDVAGAWATSAVTTK